MSKKKIFITGGAGYCGSRLVPIFLELGYRVTVYDLFYFGNHLPINNEDLTIIKGDIRDSEKIKQSCVNHDVFLNLACISNDPSFELNPNLGKSINLDSFRPLVQASIDASVRHFIYASSSSVYGVKKEANVNEEMSLEPLTDYSLFKAECEKILSEYESEDFITTTLRPATVCGFAPRQRLDVVVNILSTYAYFNRQISVFGGDQLRPNIHIEDMCNSYLTVLSSNNEKIRGQVFNVGYDNFKVIEIANQVKKIMGEDITLKIVPTDDNRSYHISSNKILKQLDFSPMFGVDDAIRDLKSAFEKNLLPNSLNDDVYFNIKRMEKIQLK